MENGKEGGGRGELPTMVLFPFSLPSKFFILNGKFLAIQNQILRFKKIIIHFQTHLGKRKVLSKNHYYYYLPLKLTDEEPPSFTQDRRGGGGQPYAPHCICRRSSTPIYKL